MRGWIKFFRETVIGEEQSDAFYQYLSQFKEKALISLKDIKLACNFRWREALNAVWTASNCGLGKLQAACPTCGQPFIEMKELASLYEEFKEIVSCKSCGSEVDAYRALLFETSRSSSQNWEDAKMTEERSYETSAALLSQIGSKQRFLYYLITDIIGSEKLQRNDSERYAEYLGFLWNDLWPNLFYRCKKIYLPVMAKGDAVVVVFSELEDVISVIKAIPQDLSVVPELQLSLVLSKIQFESADRKGFSRGLDKKWDLNTKDVTRAWRDANALGPKRENGAYDYNTRILILGKELADFLKNSDSYFSDMELKNCPYTGKHGIKRAIDYLEGFRPLSVA